VDLADEPTDGALRLDFNRRLMLQFRGSVITSDAGLLPYRELDDTLGLTDTGADTLADARTGKNGHHRLAGLLRQSVFGRLAGYADVNDADRLCRDPATVATITAEIAVARWQLDQTKLLAPTDGTITNLTLRVGDQAVENAPLIGLVDAHAWRIFANYKESLIRHMQVGGPAWVWLDTYPWHVHRATIQGIARGINRQQTERRLLPYVEPTTDWIRLQRRFPVTLVLQEPSPNIVLRMGADARTLIIY
jgi:multidrug efflux system membrane fusion protein